MPHKPFENGGLEVRAESSPLRLCLKVCFSLLFLLSAQSVIFNATLTCSIILLTRELKHTTVDPECINRQRGIVTRMSHKPHYN